MKKSWPLDPKDLEDLRRLFDVRERGEASDFLMVLLEHTRPPVINPQIVDEQASPPPPRPEPAPPPEAPPPPEETIVVIPADQAEALMAAAEEGAPLCET
jgi:hypothetical protein